MYVLRRGAMRNPVLPVSAVFILVYCLLKISEASTGVCPLSWTKHEGLCYKQMQEPKVYMDARCECAKYGAIVATLSTPAKRDFIDTWVNGTMDSYILGADRLRDDWYAWMDGVPLQNHSVVWGIDQPNDFKNVQSCLYYFIRHTWGPRIILDRHRVYDDVCNLMAVYICEKSVSDSLNSSRIWKLRSKGVIYLHKVITEYKLPSKLQCGDQCIQNCLCYSFSYNALNRSCILYNAYYRRLYGTPLIDDHSLLYD